MVKTKDWWIYQDHKTKEPWVLHLVVKKDGRSLRCEGELFAEWISNDSNDSHSFLFHLVPLSSLKGYLIGVMGGFGHGMTEQDQMQIDYECELIKESFK